MSTTVNQKLCDCSRPLRHGYAICHICKDELEKQLAEMHWLDEELEISMTRAKGIDYNRTTVSKTSDEVPLPWNNAAALAQRRLRTELTKAVQTIRARSEAAPTTDLASLAAWLLCRLERIAKRDDVQTIADGIKNASNHARDIVFAKPDDRHYIGPCEGEIIDDGRTITEVPCDGGIYVVEGSALAECALCKRAYDTTSALRAADQAVSDRLFTASEIGHLAHRTFGWPSERVRKLVVAWHRRERIVAHATNGEGTAMFRYDDVRQMLTETYAKKAS